MTKVGPVSPAGLANRHLLLLATATVSASMVAAATPTLAQQTKASVAASPSTPSANIQNAAVALQRGDLDQAILLYNDVLQDASVSNDRRAVVLAERGVALMKRRNYKAALEDFNKAASIYPEYAAVYVNRGNLLLLLSQSPDTTREAIKDFDRALILSPQLAAAYGNRGAAQLKLGNGDQAVADFSRAIELQPQNPAALNGRGRAHLVGNRTHAAIRDFTRAVVINPGFAQSYRNRAEAYMRLGRAGEAAEDLSRALAFDARRVDDYAARGAAYLAADNAASALNDFAKVVELDPKSVDGYIGLGFAKARADATEEALADLSRAVELDPRSARAYAVRAWVYKRSQQPELGEKDVERALRLEPVKADAFWAEGELKEAAGDKDAAVASYSRALGHDIHHREALAALSRLGYEPQREEVTLANAGLDGWRVIATGEQFTTTNPQFPTLRVSLEMISASQPRILSWERLKAPTNNYGLLRYAAGELPSPQGVDPVESMAIVDLARMTVIGMPIAKLHGKLANLNWTDTGVVITGADGLVETVALKDVARDLDKDAVDPRDRDVATSATRRPDQGSASRSDGPTGWTPPWNQGGYRERDNQREAARRQQQKKPKTLFDLIFGN